MTQSRLSQILAGLRTVTPAVHEGDAKEACRRLFLSSTAYQMASLSIADTGAIGDAIWRYILRTVDEEPERIMFESHTPLWGQSVGVDEFAAQMSDELWSEALPINTTDVSPAEVNLKLEEAIVALMFHYRSCEAGDSFFCVSGLLRVADQFIIHCQKPTSNRLIVICDLLTSLAALEPSASEITDGYLNARARLQDLMGHEAFQRMLAEGERRMTALIEETDRECSDDGNPRDQRRDSQEK